MEITMPAKGFMKSLSNHWTSKHGKMVPKVQFKTIEDALSFMDKRNIDKNIYHPYVCRDCGMWHIGHVKHK